MRSSDEEASDRAVALLCGGVDAPRARKIRLVMIQFACSRCATKFRVKDEFAGRATTCPTCKGSLKVPSADAAQAFALPDRVEGTRSTVRETGVDAGVSLANGTSAAAFTDTQLLANSTGRYLLQNEIARGGMGAVLKATDRDLRREVALKYMLDCSNPVKKNRFIEEAQITGQLEHPNIVPVHELGLDSKNRLFFTMKMVQGLSLGDILNSLEKKEPEAEKKWTLSKLLTVLVGICNATAYAHARGVIHRDIKPANVMIGDFGEVYVMDWGLAKVLNRKGQPTFVPSAAATGTATGDVFDFAAPPTPVSGPAPSSGSSSHSGSGSTASSSLVSTGRGQDADLTQEGAILGTPSYMSPEQARGDLHSLDERSDIYSLGGILYSILTLKTPVDKTGDHLAVLMRVVEGQIDLPEVRTPERRIPSELSAIAMKALSKEPDGRYRTVEAMRRDIELYQEGRSVSAKKDTTWEMTKKFVARNPGLSFGLGVATIILLGSLVFLFSAWREAKHANTLFHKEQQARAKTIEHALPAMARSARQLASEGEASQANSQIEVMLLYRPQDPEARLLKAQLLTSQEKWDEAKKELDRFRKVKPRDPDGEELSELIERAKTKDASVWFELARHLQFAKLAAPANIFLAKAQENAKAREPLLALYRMQVEALWPGAGKGITLSQGALVFTATSVGFIEPVKLQSPNLNALKGIPFDAIRLHGWKKLADLEVLKGMPLFELNLNGSSSLEELQVVKTLPLRKLVLANCSGIKDFEVLRGMKLEELDLSNTGVSDLSFLKGMPLRTLSIGYCTTVKDLSPLHKSSLTELTLSGCSGLTSLEPLRGLALVKLAMSNTRVRDLGPLEGMPLATFHYSATPPIDDSSPLRNAPLEYLDLQPYKDVASLGTLKLKKIRVSPKVLPSGIEVFRTMDTLRIIEVGLIDHTPEEFWAKYDKKEFK